MLDKTDLAAAIERRQAQLRPLTIDEIRRGFELWRWRHFQRKDTDNFVAQANKFSLPRPCQQQLRTVRESYYLTLSEVAKRLSIRTSTYQEIEKSETLGKITIETLGKVAKSLNCELVYFLRPANGKSFSENIWDQMWPEIKDHVWLKNCDPRLKPQAIAAIAKKLMNDAKFRKRNGWKPGKNWYQN